MAHPPRHLKVEYGKMVEVANIGLVGLKPWGLFLESTSCQTAIRLF